MAKSYAQLETDSEKIAQSSSKYADVLGKIETAPQEITEAYRKSKANKNIDEAINKSEQQMLGGFTAGVDKYSNVSNPFKRLALATKYKGTLAVEYNNLVDERTRRAGVLSEYIDKWRGLYGAEAARQKVQIDSMESKFQRDLTLKKAQESGSGSGNGNKKMSNEELIKTVNQLKGAGASWQDINDYLVEEYGVDTQQDSFADMQIRKAFGEDTLTRSEKSKQAKEDEENRIIEEMKQKDQAKENNGFFSKNRWSNAFNVLMKTKYNIK